MLAFVAALALLLFAGVDWYTTAGGAEARRIEQIAESAAPAVAPPGDAPAVSAARRAADAAERNAWQAGGTLDRVILAGLLLAAGLSLVAGFLRAAGRGPGIDPLSLAGLAAAVTLILLVVRLVGAPGADLVQAGVPLSALALTLIAVGAAMARRAGPGPDPG